MFLSPVHNPFHLAPADVCSLICQQSSTWNHLLLSACALFTLLHTTAPWFSYFLLWELYTLDTYLPLHSFVSF